MIKMKIIGMLPVYNEEDVIEEVIEHLISQEIPLVVLDNGSTDNSFKICEKFLDKGILDLKQYKSSKFQWDLILRILYDMAIAKSPDWVLRSDSDEILESGEKNMTLKEAIEKADSEGYNIIQFDRFDFFMTDDDNSDSNSIRKKLPYYSYQGDYVYRAWKVVDGIRIGDVMGHYPIFPDIINYKISTYKAVLRHYSFRSKKQALDKMKLRIRGRDSSDKDNQLFDHHERNILKQDYSKPVKHQQLTKYNEDGVWDYKIKYHPFTSKNPLKREDIFTEEGRLKNRPKSTTEYRLELIKKSEEYNKLRKESTISNRIKNFLRKKLRKNP